MTTLDTPRWLAGLARLEVVSALLQRRRLEHPTAGNFEAADLQWWWRVRRPTDDQPQPCWFDTDGPVAAATATQWRQGLGLDVHVLPSLAAEAGTEVWSAAFELAAGQEPVFAWWPDDDRFGSSVLADHGLFPDGEGDVSGWLPASEVPTVSPLADGYRLQSRADAPHGRHPLVVRNRPDVEERLRQTSLYRADLDLAVVAGSGDCAGYALFWYDPVTRVGLVEPLRVEEGHQRRGLARRLLTEGLGRLRDLGAERIRISWEDDNPAAAGLYLKVGFTPTQRMATYMRRG